MASHTIRLKRSGKHTEKTNMSVEGTRAKTCTSLETNMVHQFLQMAESRMRYTIPRGVDVFRCAGLLLMSTGEQRKLQDEAEGAPFLEGSRRRRGELVEGGMSCNTEEY